MVYNSVSHLNKVMPENAHGANATMFSIALEGWRRGLNLSFFTKSVKNKTKIRYVLSNSNKNITFQLSLAELVPKEARKTTRSKQKTKEKLFNANIPTPKGKSFNEKNGNSEIINYAKSLGYPLVIKPTKASLGIGVITGIKDDKELKECVEYLRDNKGYKEVIVEQQVTGEDTRLFVVGDQVCSAFKRIAANVVGDGEKSINELIKKKNEKRRKNPHLSGSKIKINSDLKEYLAKYDLSLQSIPPKGKRVFLNENTFASEGADTVEVTHDISVESKKIAVEAAKTLPGLVVCGVDIMVDKEKGTNYVLELNSRPNIGGSLFPVEGEAQNISKYIVDYYFPETMGYGYLPGSDMLYFDYKRIEKILKDGFVESVTVPPIPQGDLVFKELKVTGAVQGVGFRKWIHKQATGRKLNGYVKNMKDKSVRIVVGGKEKKVSQLLEVLKNHNVSNIKIESVEEKEWNKPMKMGFEMIKKSNSNTKLKKRLSTVKRENKELIQKLNQSTKQLKDIKQSKSWRYTFPIRKIRHLVKNK